MNIFTYANLRNVIVHNPDKRHAHPIADPHDKVVEKYEKILLKVQNPAKAIDRIAVRRENIFVSSLDDSALEVMATMNKNIYTHVPIIEDGILIGVFSENTIFFYLVKTKDALSEYRLTVPDADNLAKRAVAVLNER